MTLIVQSCSGSKQDVEGEIPAIELYTGYFYKIIDKARREDDISEDVELCILSAEHGIVDPDDEIEWYDRRMDSERADELRDEVVEAVADRAAGHDDVVINAGSEYRRAVNGLQDIVDAEVYSIEGSGIGAKGSALKQVVRSGEVEGSAFSST